MKYIAAFMFVSWGLLGCSSSGPRAPVSDLTLNNHNRYAKASDGGYSPAKKSNTYKVKRGDTLYAIAWQSGLDVKTLVNYNGISAPYVIYEGQILNLSAAEKTIRAEKTSPKSNLTSQKKDKKSPTYCTDQSCNKNTAGKLVQKKTKVYSADKVVGKVLKKAPQKTDDKKINSWQWPASGKLTKTFSSSQLGMKGISLTNKRGTAVYAATSGEVVYAGSGLSGYGNLIIIKHNYDYLSAYAHNEKLLVRENEAIKEGQKIAIMGDSGTDSVHLHFEIRYRGKSVDPLRYLPKR